MFISHPIPEFIPKNVPAEKVVYLPATTDWLDYPHFLALNVIVDA